MQHDCEALTCSDGEVNAALYFTRLRPRPRLITERPRPKNWSRDHAGLETLISLTGCEIHRTLQCHNTYITGWFGSSTSSTSSPMISLKHFSQYEYLQKLENSNMVRSWPTFNNDDNNNKVL